MWGIRNGCLNRHETYDTILQAANYIAKNIKDFSKDSHSIALYIRDELSNMNFKRKAIVKSWEQVDIYRISQKCAARLIAERDNAIKKQREDYYVNGPAQRITEEGDRTIVEYGRVEKVEERKFDYFSIEGGVDWDAYNEHRLSAGKKCQIIKLADDNREFRVVFSISARGVETFDVIRFEGIIHENFINIHRISNISGTGTFSIANPITVGNTWFFATFERNTIAGKPGLWQYWVLIKKAHVLDIVLTWIVSGCRRTIHLTMPPREMDSCMHTVHDPSRPCFCPRRFSLQAG